MIRSINDQFGFADRYTTNEMIMDWDKYPAQKEDAIGKYVSLNLMSERGIFMKYRVRIRKDLKEEYSDFIPEEYDQTIQEYFRILRYDIEEPYKVILVSLSGQVIVTTKERIENLVYINDEMCTRARDYITKLGEEYLEPTNIVDTYEDFFTQLFKEEKIESYPIQNNKMLLRPVWIEWASDITNYDIEYNEGPEKNDHRFTTQIKDRMIEYNPKLYGKSDREINSYPYIHDLHGESYVDDPRRVKAGRGYIIRADQNAAYPEIVVMYQYGDENNSYRVITLDEAKFYYITNVEERTNDVEEHDIYTALYNYIVYGNQYVPSEVVIEDITDEEEMRDEDAWQLEDLDCGDEDENVDDTLFDFGFGFEDDYSFLWDFEDPEFNFSLEPAVLNDPDIMGLEIWDFDRLKDQDDDETWDFDTAILNVDDDPETVVYDFFYDPLYLDQTDLMFDFDVAEDDTSVPYVYDFEILSEPYMDPINNIDPDAEIWDFTSDELIPSEDDIIFDFWKDFELDEDGNPVYPEDWKDTDPVEEEPIDFGYDIIIYPDDDNLQIWDYGSNDDEIPDDEITWDFNIEDDEMIYIYDCNE